MLQFLVTLSLINVGNQKYTQIATGSYENVS